MSTISPKKIYDEVSKKVIGQEEAKRTISNAMFLHFVNYCRTYDNKEAEAKKCNVLLMGPTGSGKTYIVREAVKAVQKMTGWDVCPMLEVDCTSISAPGWTGDDLDALIGGHYDEHGSNEACFNSSVVFLDEFDKICKSAVGSGGTDHNRNTQYSMLKTIEGTQIKHKKRTIDTSKMLFIMAGNFSEVRQLEADRGHVMGFRSPEVEETYVDFHTELEEVGMATQLVGRTPYVAKLNYLTEEELTIILNEHDIPEMEKTWKFLDSKLEIDKDVQKQLVRNAFERKTGARGLQFDLAKHLEDQLFSLEMKI